MIKRNKTILLLVLTLGILLIGCSKSDKETDSSNTTTVSPSTEAAANTAAVPTTAVEPTTTAEPTAADLQSFKFGLGVNTDVAQGVLGVAAKEGYLDEELAKVGYKSEFIGFAQGGPAVNEALVSGDIDAAYYGDLPATILKSKGIDTSIVSFAETQGNLSIAVAEASDISSPKDLEGKKVLVSLGTAVEQYWEKVVKEYNLDTSKIEIINDPANAIQTFVSGNADALVTVDIYIKIVGAKTPIKIIDSTKANHPDWGYQVVIAARNEFSAAHPEVITALLKAYIRAYDDIVADQSLLVNSYVVEGSVTQELAESIYGDVDISLYDGDIADENITKLEELNTFMVDKQLITESVDVKSFIDPSFYEAAKAALGK